MEVVRKVKCVIEPRKGLPKGMGFHEYFKLTDEVDDSLAHYEKDEISLAYSKLTMDDIEKHFGIPREPVPLLFPSLGMPVPETLGKLS